MNELMSTNGSSGANYSPNGALLETLQMPTFAESDRDPWPVEWWKDFKFMQIKILQHPVCPMVDRIGKNCIENDYEGPGSCKCVHCQLLDELISMKAKLIDPDSYALLRDGAIHAVNGETVGPIVYLFNMEANDLIDDIKLDRMRR